MQGIDTGARLFRSPSGRWAGEQLLKALNEGRQISPAVLRTADTLRHEEWKHFDEALVSEALIQLVGVADLIDMGLTRPVPDSMAKTVFAYEKMTYMDVADVTLDGVTRSMFDRQEFEMFQVPLPITHKDFFINLRTLMASRQFGEPLDTTQVRTAGRVVAEKQELMLFQGGPTFGALPLYGYTTHPNRVTVGFGTNGNWATTNTAKTGANILADVLTLVQSAQNQRFFGPYGIYVDRLAAATLENDYNPTYSTKTIRQRIEEIEQIQFVHVADQMPANAVVLVNLTADTAVMVQGEPLQTVQWDVEGGFHIHFKAFQIQIPLLRSDIQGRCGIVHMS